MNGRDVLGAGVDLVPPALAFQRLGLAGYKREPDQLIDLLLTGSSLNLILQRPQQK